MLSVEQFYDASASIGNFYNKSAWITSHNFLKACIIEKFIPENAKIIDLGCGKGGDFKKLKRKHLKEYIGIDISRESIAIAKQRAIYGFFPCKLLIDDFTKLDWLKRDYFDVIMAQFSIHYAFTSEENAKKTIHAIAKSLKKNGVFLGTMPMHEEEKSYSLTTFSVSDKFSTQEPVVNKETIQAIFKQNNFEVILWKTFEEYFECCCEEFPHILKKMNVTVQPQQNWIFVFRLIDSADACKHQTNPKTA